MGFARLMLKSRSEPLAPSKRQLVERMIEVAASMGRLVDDLLDMTRIHAGTFTVEAVAQPVGPVVEHVVVALGPAAEHKGHRLAADAPADLPPAPFDAQRLGQVLYNLVSNAIKFTPEGGRITLRVREAPEGLRFEVADTGIGIAAEDLGRLFRRFGRLDGSDTRATGGIGLGLAISKAIVEAHHGRIGATSEPGVGSVFWFTLPRATAPAT
jgi:signal transduction histidine kinase